MTKPYKAMQSETNLEHETTSSEQVLSADQNEKKGVQTSDAAAQVKEVGGPKGLEPTRYGDWESKGRCYDF